MNFYKRTHTCGELRISDIGKNVALNGWVATIRDMGKLIFIDLRDRYGITQLVVLPEENQEMAQKAREIKTEFVISIIGLVRERENKNSKLPTGDIEVIIDNLLIINKAELSPFEITNDIETNEEIRLRYRFLDLRRPILQNFLSVRNECYQIIHKYFHSQHFIEIETPILMKSTPEGARDFLVPSRINKGKFYALPQSPQLYKQILMIAGFDRYIQIAKCFRDEDLRSDRQPEFTQIDLEMSFVDAEDIISITEGLFVEIWDKLLGIKIEHPFPRMSYYEAMTKYGSDKPDIRFPLELITISDIVANSDFKVFSDTIANSGVVACLNAKGCASFSRKDIDSLTDYAKKYGAKGLATIKSANGEIISPIAKFLSESIIEKIKSRTQLEDGDLLLIVADDWTKTYTILGALRTEIARRKGILNLIKDKFSFHWVVDFPLLEYDNEANRYVAMHHPFTSPKDEDIPLLESNPSKARAKAYDIIINGAEIGGGSIRIHNPEIQEKMFNLLGMSEKEAENKFGFLLNALKFGAPPHGGIALGLDRIIMTITGTENIRDVIAFPKTTSGLSLMDGAPSYVEPSQLNELGIMLINKTQNYY